jgi:hypothetical protein
MAETGSVSFNWKFSVCSNWWSFTMCRVHDFNIWPNKVHKTLIKKKKIYQWLFHKTDMIHMKNDSTNNYGQEDHGFVNWLPLGIDWNYVKVQQDKLWVKVYSLISHLRHQLNEGIWQWCIFVASHKLPLVFSLPTAKYLQ